MKKKYITPLAELIVIGTGNVMDDIKTTSQEAEDTDPLAKKSDTYFEDWDDEEDE